MPDTSTLEYLTDALQCALSHVPAFEREVLATRVRHYETANPTRSVQPGLRQLLDVMKRAQEA